MVPSDVVRIREYHDQSGRVPFRRWFEALNAQAAAKVTIALARLESGNFSNVKGVGSGVYEIRIHFGPGYRVYFGEDGEEAVILLAGGVKQRRSRDIQLAMQFWQDYHRRKR